MPYNLLMPEKEDHRSPQAWWLPVWQRRWWIALATLFILIWWLVPPLLYRHTGTAKDAKLKAITDTRTALLAGLIGVGALLTFWLNSRVYRLTQQGQLTDRYTKAIEQLGAAKLDVRLGGIYALERIAVDSQRDHPTVVEVLGAFVREASQRHGTPPPKPTMTDEETERPDATTPGTDGEPRPATDVQAALSVLGRLPQRPKVSRGDLTGAQIVGARLDGANLSGAALNRANLSGAALDDANLSGAALNGANLSGARLNRANLSGAWLPRADLSGAQFAWANLSSAHLLRADLSGAGLQGTNLSRATLYGVDLRQAQELMQPQLDVALGNAETQLPDGRVRPASWPSRAPPASPGSSPMTG
jgi:hypothetical protein